MNGDMHYFLLFCGSLNTTFQRTEVLSFDEAQLSIFLNQLCFVPYLRNLPLPNVIKISPMFISAVNGFRFTFKYLIGYIFANSSFPPVFFISCLRCP